MIDFTKITKENFGKHFDHTCLGKWRSEEEIRAAARVARKYNVACFGTSTSYWTPVVLEELEGTDITAGIGVDFPFGASAPAVKAMDVEYGIKRGATCVDYVINLGAFKSKQYDVIHEEARVVRKACGSIMCKAILEVCYMDDEEVRTACEIVASEGIEWAKSSSGQYAGPTINQVRIMCDAVKGSNTRVKVAGVKAPKPINAAAYMLAGADLIGTQDADMIIESLDELRAIGMIPEYKAD